MKTEKDKEGHPNEVYDPAQEILAEMWPAGGKMQAELYGLRLPNIRNLRIQGKYQEISQNGEVRFQIENGPSITIKDGINLYIGSTEAPDYEIVAIRPYAHLTLEVERRV